MADRIVTAGKAYPTPNWDKWRLIPESSLWQCVALSLNIDPDSIEIDPIFGRDPIFPRRHREFKDRRDITSAHLNRTLRCTSVAMGSPLLCHVSLRDFAAWVRQIGWEAPHELLAMADEQGPAAEAQSPQRCARHEEIAGNIFKTMAGLKWSGISITLIEPEAVRIKARGVSKTFTYEAMGFKNQRSLAAKPNKVWETLQTIAIAANTDKTLADVLPPQTGFKRRVSRLRVALQEFFGIEDDPILYYDGEYKPAFVLAIEDHVRRHVRDRIIDSEDEGDIEE